MSLMQEKIFEWSEKLKITASERRAISLLLLVYLSLKLIRIGYEDITKGSKIDFAPQEIIQSSSNLATASPKDASIAKIAESEDFEQFMTQKKVDLDTALSNPPSLSHVTKKADAVDINTATEQQLITLPGIGPTYAKRIIAWREINGKFNSIEELLQIKGIGPARLKKMSAMIHLGNKESNNK